MTRRDGQTATLAAPCRHHFLIEPPNGPSSPGVCRLCGEQREFRNVLAYSLWEGYDDVAEVKAARRELRLRDRPWRYDDG